MSPIVMIGELRPRASLVLRPDASSIDPRYFLRGTAHYAGTGT